jgi:hypothetical protein
MSQLDAQLFAAEFEFACTLIQLALQFPAFSAQTPYPQQSAAEQQDRHSHEAKANKPQDRHQRLQTGCKR